MKEDEWGKNALKTGLVSVKFLWYDSGIKPSCFSRQRGGS